MEDLNSINLVGRLTRDPELRSLAGGTSLASLRVAFNTSKKDSDGTWGDKGNFIAVTVFGAQAEALCRNLSKGQRVGLNGRLEHREFTTQDGTQRETIEIIANRVYYLDPKADGAGGGGGGQRSARPAAARPEAAPVDSESVPF